ncbi:MAG: YceH family protein [Gaiellaceae bacterium]
MDVDAVEIRVLGCLIEKQRTTPDQYPLSLNALRLACNQSTNRDPVVDYDEREIKAALDRMSNRGWTRFASGASSRALKYRHLLDEALSLSDDELCVLAVLMLRGPQTPGELKQRTERMHRFGSPADVVQTLERLAGRELVQRLGRRPGQKEERWEQLLGGAEPNTDAPASDPAPPVQAPDIEARVTRLEQLVEDLRARLDA